MVWGANFAVRRSAVERVGNSTRGSCTPTATRSEWLERLRAAGGTIVYLAAAGSITAAPRPTPAWGRWPVRPTPAAGAPASDRRRRRAPGLHRELRVLAGCGWHTLRRACPQGVIMGAHAAGRVAEALRPERS